MVFVMMTGRMVEGGAMIQRRFVFFVCILNFVFCILCFLFCILCFVFCVLYFVFDDREDGGRRGYDPETYSRLVWALEDAERW